MVSYHQEARNAIKAAVIEEMDEDEATVRTTTYNVGLADKDENTSKDTSIEIETEARWNDEVVGTYTVHLWWNGSKWAAEV